MSIVIDIGEFRITKTHRFGRVVGFGKTEEQCEHFHVTLDDHGHVVTCDDCHIQVSPYWFIRDFFERYDRTRERLEYRMREVEAAEERTIVHRALLKIQEAWKRRKYLPCCPHCFRAIAPTDGFGNSQKRIISRHGEKL